MSGIGRRATLLAMPGVAMAAGTAWAHHGWGSYDASTPVQVTGTVESADLDNPHATMLLATPGKTWECVLAPPGRMTSRGLRPAMLQPGATVEAYGYPHRSRDIEMRAEWIRIAGTTYQLR